MVSIAGVLLTDDGLREEVVEGLFELLPLQSGAGKEDLEELIEPIAQRSVRGGGDLDPGPDLGGDGDDVGAALQPGYGLGPGVSAAVRAGQLVDLGLVIGVGALLTISIGATAVLQVGTDVSESVSDSLGPFGAEAAASSAW